jgi:aminoglycoside phosphotransferase (APT) family kinase protein
MFHFLPGATADRSPLQRHVDEQRAYYEWVVADGQRSPLIEAAFDWLDAHWPDEEGPTVLSWGDSRIGNVLYRDFEPVAILDWEMASLGPPELDVGWLITLHAFFEDVAKTYGLPGLPDFLRRDDVVAQYEALTGYTPRDLDFYCAYASTRHATIMSRIGRRSIHFGETEAPADIDELIPHRAMLEAMLAGTYEFS